MHIKLYCSSLNNKKVSSQGNDHLTLQVSAILIFKMATTKTIMLWGLIRKWLLEVQRAAMQKLALSTENERFCKMMWH